MYMLVLFLLFQLSTCRYYRTSFFLSISGKLKKNYSQSEGRIILSNVNSSTNAMLLITSANMSLDRGKYECVVESAVGPSPTNTTFMVRIKSEQQLFIVAQSIHLLTWDKKGNTEVYTCDIQIF